MKLNFSTVLSAILSVIALVVSVCAGTICLAAGGAHKADGDVSTEAETHGFGADFTLVHDLYAYSDEYLNKEVAVTGLYSNSLVQEDGSLVEPEETEAVYHFLTVFDTAGDCFFTIEFTSISGEYPDIGDLVHVSGVFSKYTEDNLEYVTIADSEWTLIESGISSVSEAEVDTIPKLDNISAQESEENVEEAIVDESQTGVAEAS